MMRQVLIAAGSALVGLVPGYLIGKAIRGRTTVYQVVFWGEIVFMVPVVAWSLAVGYMEVAAIALGFTFGMINGLRHGFSPVFAPLVEAARHAEDQEQ